MNALTRAFRYSRGVENEVGEEFAAAVRGDAKPEMDGERSTASLAVLLAGIKSAREGRRIEIAEMLA